MKRLLINSLIALGLGASFGMAQANDLVRIPGERQAKPYGQSAPVPGRYIVVYKKSVENSETETEKHVAKGSKKLHHVFNGSFKGFSAELNDSEVKNIRNHPNVEMVEQDRTISIQELPVARSQSQATWGIDRIDQVTRPLDTVYHYNYTGVGVNAFIIDTGIRTDHVEFVGRIKPGYNVAPDAAGVVNASNVSDCNGHGTHVSGTVGGTVLGVAKGVSIVPVRVLDCAGSGFTSGVIDGVNWVANSPLRPAVANLSLGGSLSPALNSAIANAVSKGVTVVVAAGNSNTDACTSSPASEPTAITVGATDSTDVRASYSNYGSCLDVFAPGSGITSAWYTASNAAAVLSGTSMASPHVTGTVALALAANPAATPTDIAALLKAKSSANQVTSAGTGSPNLLVYSQLGAATPVANQTVAIKSIAAASSKTKTAWTAAATVSVRDTTTGAAVPNATVSGSFVPGGNASCVTNSTGSCKLSSTALALNTLSSTLTITGVTGLNMTYNAPLNAATQIILKRP
jgi:aqualysin 1